MRRAFPWARVLAATTTTSPLFAVTRRASDVARADDDLVHVSCYFRHGARCPVFGMDHAVVQAQRWDTCAASAKRSEALDAGTDTILKLRGLGTDEPPRPSIVDAEQRAHVLPGGGRAGELTAEGYAQGLRLGQRLRARYPGMAETAPDCRTTHVARCVLTLRAVLEGLGVSATPVPVDTRHATEETLTPSTRRCRALATHWQGCRELLRSEGGGHAAAADPGGHFASLMRKVPAADAEAFGFPKTTVPLKDALIAIDALPAALPWGVTKAELQALDDRAAAEVALLVGVGHSDDPEEADRVLRLAAGPLVHELVTALDAAAAGGGPALRLVSGHDTTVKPLLVALDLYDHKWPPFSASVLVELRRGPEGLRVVISYDGKTSPEASAAPSEWYVVDDQPFDVFMARMRGLALDEATWLNACGGGPGGDGAAGGATFAP